MTRARDRLYVLGGDKWRAEEHDSPLRRIQQSAAAGACGTIERDDPDFLGRPPAPIQEVALARSASNACIQMYRAWQPPVLRERMRIISPSDTEKEMPSAPSQKRPPGGNSGGESGLSPTERGNRVHQLLQLAAERGSMPPGAGETYDEAAAVFENPELAWIFRPENGRGLSEVPIIHRRMAASTDQIEERITGSIDRLILRPGRVDIVDYKTNRLEGDQDHQKALIEYYQPQLAAYREAVQSFYPDREVRTWLLFTDPGFPDADKFVEVSS
jgi:hypothetical protein